MNQYESVAEYEREFIAETFAQHWPVSAIAHKLERPTVTIESIIRGMGLKRDSHGVKTPQKDWPSIWFAYQANASYAETARAMDMSRQVVAYAIQAMILMGTEQRLIRWNKYAVKHGRDLYTFKDANGSI